MTVALHWLESFGRFWYGFIIGDDRTAAATMAVALVVDLTAARGGRSRRVVAAGRCRGRRWDRVRRRGW